MGLSSEERALRQAVIDGYQSMNAKGLNQGTAGNMSVRYNDRMLITPSGIPCERLEPEMLASLPIEGEYGAFEGPLEPSTEWRFHLDIQRARPDVGAVVHMHSTFATVLAIAHKPIPACHYMIAAFGGHDVRCCGYAQYGTEELSREVISGLEGRKASLMANHGMIVVGSNLERALWRAVELETIAKQYYYSLQIGGPILLSEAQIEHNIKASANYGLQSHKIQ